MGTPGFRKLQVELRVLVDSEERIRKKRNRGPWGRPKRKSVTILERNQK